MINMGPQRLGKIVFYYVLALILLAFVGWISIYTDWLWFTEIGFQKIFTTIWSTRLLAGLIAGIAVFGIVYLNLFICERLTKEKNAHKRLRPKPLIVEEDNIERRIDVGTFIKNFTVPVLLIIAVMAGFFAAGQWQTILQYIHQTLYRGIQYSRKLGKQHFTRWQSGKRQDVLRLKNFSFEDAC